MSSFYPHFQNANHSQSHSVLLPTVESLLKDLKPGSKVLDLGCGNGSMIATFKKYNWQLFGTDLSDMGMEVAKSSHHGITFFSSDLTAVTPQEVLAQCEGPLDAIISTEVVEHLYLPRPFAKLCFEVLKPGSRLVMSTPYHGYAKNVAIALLGKTDFHHSPLWDYGHVKFWSKPTLSTLLSEAGFVNLKFHGVGRVPYLWKSMIARAWTPS